MTEMHTLENEDDSPLDIIEHLVVANDWVFERPNNQEIAIQVPGRWCDYNIYFAWNSSASAMHFSLAVDNRVPRKRLCPCASYWRWPTKSCGPAISRCGRTKAFSPTVTH